MMPATASLLEKYELGKFPIKRYFQQLLSRTNLILPWKIIQILGNFDVDWKGLRSWRLLIRRAQGISRRTYDFFQTRLCKILQNPKRHLPKECFLLRMLHFYISTAVFYNPPSISYVLCLFAQGNSPFTVWTWGPQGHWAVMFRCLRCLDVPVKKKRCWENVSGAHFTQFSITKALFSKKQVLSKKSELLRNA